MKIFNVIKASAPHISDEELVKRYKSNDEKAFFGQLFLRYSHLIMGLCMKYFKDEDQAKDAVMSIFEKLLVDVKKFEIQYFKSWVYIYSKNYCLMQLRKKTGEISMSEIKNFEDNFMENSTPEHLNTEKEENLSILEKGIESLSTEQKSCIKLFYLEEKSYQEITESTGFELSKVKSYIQNGKRNLKIFIEQNKIILILINLYSAFLK